MSATKENIAQNRITRLVDEGSFVELFGSVVSRTTDLTIKEFSEESDGVVTGYGLINGRLVFLYSQNPDVLNGSLGEMHCKKIVEIYTQAAKMGAPIIAMLDSSGMRLQEGADVLAGLGEVISAANEISGLVPTFSVVYGNCGGGLSLIPALSDFSYIIKEKGHLFVNAPNTIDGNYVEKLDPSKAEYQAEKSGVVDEALTEEDMIAQITSLLMMLPANNTEGVYASECRDDLNRLLQGHQKENYDPMAFVVDLADEHIFIETKRDFAQDIMTGFLQLNGMTVAVLANRNENQKLSVNALLKAKDFVRFADNYDIPILSLVDACGFDASLEAELGLLRAMSGFVSAIADAQVPKVTLIPRKAYGTPYLMMCAKAMGADFVYAWPNAEMGIMPADMAKKILPEEAANYETTHNGVENFTKRALVDRMIEPASSRKYLLSAFDLLYTKYACVQDKKHSLR